MKIRPYETTDKDATAIPHKWTGRKPADCMLFERKALIPAIPAIPAKCSFFSIHLLTLNPPRPSPVTMQQNIKHAVLAQYPPTYIIKGRIHG